MTDEPRKVCAVCGRTLSHVTSPDGPAEYMHGMQDSPEDHPAVAVDPGTERDRPRCDFCNEDDPTRVVPARSFELADVPQSASVRGWAACDTCAALVDTGQWSALTRRARAGFEGRYGPMDAVGVTALKGMYRQLRKNVTGASIPIGEYQEG